MCYHHHKYSTLSSDVKQDSYLKTKTKTKTVTPKTKTKTKRVTLKTKTKTKTVTLKAKTKTVKNSTRSNVLHLFTP